MLQVAVSPGFFLYNDTFFQVYISVNLYILLEFSLCREKPVYTPKFPAEKADISYKMD